jgi:chromosome partitioning protein
VTTDNDESDLFHWLDGAAAWANFVIADPEGSANRWMDAAASQADLVIIPFSATFMDADQVTQTVLKLRTIERMARKEIPFRVLMTRTTPLPTRDERLLRESMTQKHLPMLKTHLQDRPAFRALFMRQALLQELDDTEINGLPKARLNASDLVAEIAAVLTAQGDAS